MKLLLDTHTFIWAVSNRRKLPAKILSAIENGENDIFVSSVSFWEIAIKIRIGTLEPIGNDDRDLVTIAEASDFQPIGLLPSEASTSFELAENSHFDPFDRMLIWQAIQRDMILVSGDPEFKKFKADGLKLLWK
ncbi:MAG: type II toxin-antitoxin system VapC family toxin [Pyrinomonadaceae bacterium]